MLLLYGTEEEPELEVLIVMCLRLDPGAEKGHYWKNWGNPMRSEA